MFMLDYGNGPRGRQFRWRADAEAFAKSERAILRNPSVHVVDCSRDDDPTQHDVPRGGWVARALSNTLPPIVNVGGR